MGLRVVHRTIQLLGQPLCQRRQRRWAARLQPLPGLQAEGTAQWLQFVDPGGHRRAADAVQRAVAHAAGRGDLRQRAQIGTRGHQGAQVGGQNIARAHRIGLRQPV
jgi:hypothetical protein